MNIEERKAYMKRLADKARADYRQLQMERAAKTAAAIRAAEPADPERLQRFLDGED